LDRWLGKPLGFASLHLGLWPPSRARVPCLGQKVIKT